MSSYVATFHLLVAVKPNLTIDSTTIPRLKTSTIIFPNKQARTNTDRLLLSHGVSLNPHDNARHTHSLPPSLSTLLHKIRHHHCTKRHCQQARQ